MLKIKRRSSFKNHIHSNQSNKLSFWSLYTLFLLNDHTFKIKKIELWLWRMMKYELFYIGGACAHSGNCCRHLMIYDHGKAVNNKAAFQKKCRKQNTFTRFIPQFKNDGRISSYMCKCLTQENTCNDYENRPKLCHNYPMSHFMLFDRILDGCGYKVCRKEFFPRIRNKNLLLYIEKVALS